MAACPYCKIVTGDLESIVVHQDQLCTAFMSIQPINPGHLILVPNEHIPDLEGLSPDTAAHLFQIGGQLGRAVRHSGIQCQGINLYLAESWAGSQEVPHLHLHIIPRFEGDGFDFQYSPRYAELPTRRELENNAFYIKQALQELIPGE